jgi:hypothetical protein
MTLQIVVFSSKIRISSCTPSGSCLGKRDDVISVARISSRHSRQITLSFCMEFLPVSCVAAISFRGRLSKFNDNSSRFCFLKELCRRDNAMWVAQGWRLHPLFGWQWYYIRYATRLWDSNWPLLLSLKKARGHKGFPYGLLKQRRLTEPTKTEKDFLPLTGSQIEHSNQLGHRSFSIRSS